jgi:hypothetical protein
MNILKEKNSILNGLKEKARLVTELLNKIEGVKCNPVQGVLYYFYIILKEYKLKFYVI